MSRYSIEEQQEILSEVRTALRQAGDGLDCIDGDLADSARFDVQCAQRTVVKVLQDLATAEATP